MLDCPQGTFQGAGVKTVVLFFDKGAPTRRIWYYQLDPGRSLGKTNALNDDDLTRRITYTLGQTEASSPLGALMHHAANHGVHHRGQAAMLLRELGYTPGNIDILFYYQEREGKQD